MDRDIKVVVRDKVAKAVGDPVIICGNSDYTITFSFDDEWAGVEVKTARFKYMTADGAKHQDKPFTGDTVEVPALANTREVKVGVYAGDLTTTTGAPIRCKPCIRCGSGEEVAPEPDKYDALMELIKEGLGGKIDPETIDKAVKEYLENNPIQGTTDHSKLTNRDADDQHPISAITGLQNELNKLQNAKNIILKNNDPEFWDSEDDISVQTAIEWLKLRQLYVLNQAGYINYTLTDPESESVEVVTVQTIIDAIISVISEISEAEYITAKDMPEIVKSVIDGLPKYNGEVAEV